MAKRQALARERPSQVRRPGPATDEQVDEPTRSGVPASPVRAVSGPLSTPDVLSLQRAAGNRATCGVLAQSPESGVIRRTIGTAADALYKSGVKVIKTADLKGPFLKEHGVTAKQKAEIQAALDLLRGQGQAAEAQAAARRALVAMLDDTSGVTLNRGGVEVHLDDAQNKHQHPDEPIGTRTVSGGNLFKALADPAWHQANTMVHMADWAAGLQMVEGQEIQHGQLKAVAGIHYEGKCLLCDGRRYVTFHCYPATGNKDLNAGFKK